MNARIEQVRLSEHGATTSMISTIHVLKARAGLDDDTYRDFLERETGQRSAKHLSVTQAGRVIERLREVTGQKRRRAGRRHWT
jgi:phage gp16-like protein